MLHTIKTSYEAIPDFSLRYTSIDKNLKTTSHVTSTAFESLRIQKFTNVVASYSPSGVFRTDGSVITESLLPQYRHCGGIDTQLVSRLTPVPGEFIFMGQIINHYGHFFVDALSRFWALDKDFLQGKKLVYLYNPTLTFYSRENSPHVSDFFSFSGIDVERDLRLVFRPELFETLYIPSPAASREFSIHPYRLHEMARVVERLRQRRPSFTPPSRVYFSRQGLPVSTRYILNEDDVVKVHESFGFTAVKPHALDMEEEMLFCSNMDVVSCLHCSAINNAMFSSNVTTGIILYDDYVNYRDPVMMHIVSPIIKNVYALKNVVKPAYDFNGNFFWYTTACEIDIDVLRTQASFLLKEKPSRLHSVAFLCDDAVKSDLCANIASSLIHFGMYHKAGLLQIIAKKFDPSRRFVKEVEDILAKEQQNPQGERPLSNRCFTIDFTRCSFVHNALRLHLEDEEYFHHFANVADLLAMLIPRFGLKRIAGPAQLKERLDTFGVSIVDGSEMCSEEAAADCDAVVIDGSCGYSHVRTQFDRVLAAVPPDAGPRFIAVHSVLPFDKEYYPRLVSNPKQFREFQFERRLDGWKLAWDLAHNFPDLAYVTLNIDNGILLVAVNGATKRTAGAVDAVKALDPEADFSDNWGCLRLVAAKHFHRLLRCSPPDFATLFQGIPVLPGQPQEYLSEDDAIGSFPFNKSRAAQADAPYLLAELIAFSYRAAVAADVAVVGGWEAHAGLYIVNNTVIGTPQAVLPDEETLCVFDVAGQELDAILTDAVAQCTPTKNRYYPHVSGMDLSRDRQGFITPYAIGWRRFDPDARYRLVVNSRFANGYPGYQSLALRPHHDTGLTCRAALAMTLSRHVYA